MTLLSLAVIRKAISKLGLCKMRRVDLHIHTTFSDGQNSLEDVVEYARLHDFSQVCISDHNSLAGTISLSEENLPENFLFGLETRLPGLPDFLLYFPRLDCSNAFKIQAEFDSISQFDQDVTQKSCAELFQGDMLFAWRQSRFYNSTGNKWLGTLQLAQLLSNSFVPDHKVVFQIRRLKSLCFANTKDCDSAKQLLLRSRLSWIVGLASNYAGHVSLAHPFREIVRRNRDCRAFNFTTFCSALESLLNDMKKEGVESVEHITAYSKSWWDEHFNFSLNAANQCLFSLCDSVGFSLTSGTDSHDFRKVYDLLAPCEDDDVQKRLADWIK